jgi:hypothetical protein
MSLNRYQQSLMYLNLQPGFLIKMIVYNIKLYLMHFLNADIHALYHKSNFKKFNSLFLRDLRIKWFHQKHYEMIN